MRLLATMICLGIVAISPLIGENDQLRLISEKYYSIYSDWRAYGTFVLAPYTNTDNPDTNILGLEGEVKLPYTVPEGYELTIDYLQIEGPAGPQVGMALWLGEMPCENSKSIISCTTAGGSTQLHGMNITIPEGQIVNIRVMNNTAIPWCNGFYLEGFLSKKPKEWSEDVWN